MNNLSEFLITTGRTLSQMSLYNIDHPNVQEAFKDSHEKLAAVLHETAEIVLSVNENKLLVNGRPQDQLSDVAVRPFVQLLTKFDLHSLSFEAGVSTDELVPFFQLAAKGDFKKLGMSVGEFFASKNVVHIKVNQAKYAKIGEDDIISSKGAIAGGPSQTAGGAAGVGTDPAREGGDGQSMGSDPADSAVGAGIGFASQLENLGLDEMLRKLIEKAVTSPEERVKILNLVTKHIKLEIEDAVNKATVALKKETVKASNERDRSESVVESMADGVVVVDESGHVVMMNPAAEQIYGVKLGACVGKPLWEGVKEEQMVALARDLSVPTDRPMVKEVQLKAAQETKRVLRASAATVQDVNGRVVGMVSVLSDVTKQKELNRLQNEFMANVTHDLRTPIHALKLAVGAILEGAAGPVSAEQDKMLTLANRNVERLSRLIDDLLDFSQIESGTLKMNLQVIGLGPLIKEAVQSLESWVKSRNVKLAYEEEKNLPTVYADSDRFLQIVINLVSNAIKFSPSGSVVIVRTKAVQEKNKPMVRIEIEDSGKGISMEDQKRIFGRFVQLANQEKMDVRGTGLGLSICKALVDLQHGSLNVESPPPGKSTGSLFYFTLPTPTKTTTVPAAPAAPVEMAAVKPKKKGFWQNLFSRFSVLMVAASLFSVMAYARPYLGTVRRVISADTIQLEDGTLVRYQGITIVEEGNALYPEAVSQSRSLVEGKDVTLDYGPDERDQDGVWQAYVYADGIFVNEELVRSGLALVARLENEIDMSRKLVVAEREAKREQRGLWNELNSEPPAGESQAPTSTLPIASDEEIRKGIKE